MHSGVLNTPLHHNGVDTSITLDAAKWNCSGGEFSSLSHWIMYLIFRTLSEHIYQLTLNPFLFYVLIYMFMFLVYCDLHV